jgi:hypothetical protein
VSDDSESGIMAEAMVSGNPDSPNYLQGIVKLSWGNENGIVDISTARKLAIRILEAATSAETDELYVRWLTTKMNMPLQAAVLVLRDIRNMRTDWLR